MKKAEAGVLEVHPLKRGDLTLKVVGETPLFFNSMSAKAQRSLLLGGGRKTAAERRDIKHSPRDEFRDSVYLSNDERTLLGFPAAGVKGAMATAALETPGVTKSSVQRLIFLPQERVNIWGTPQLRCDVVRSADMAKTPDIRTRAFLPEWCAEVNIRFVTSLSEASIVSLLSNAGLIVGLGDFRQEKGKGAFGAFRVVASDDADWARIAASGGYAQQKAAMEAPEPANEETRTLLGFFDEEVAKRTAKAA